MASLLSFSNPLPMHRWHKMLTFIGLALLAISLIFPPTWLPSNRVGLLGLGFMLYGLGDWKRIRTRLKGDLQTDWVGLGMQVTGGIFLLWSLAAVVRFALGI